jgi:hypothetical protein
MNHTPTEGNRSAPTSEMLSDVEERTLSRLRDMVAMLRASGRAVEISSMEEEIRAAGGSRVHSAENNGPDTFLMCGARFTLRASNSMPGKIELNFVPLSR